MPRPAESEHLVAFHESEYVAFLRTVTPDNMVPALSLPPAALRMQQGAPHGSPCPVAHAAHHLDGLCRF